MSAKSLDAHGRWRNVTVAFRVSPEEDEQIERLVRLTGLTKQDYNMRRLTEQDIVVQGNPRVYAALQREMKAILDELARLAAGNNPSEELMEIIRATKTAEQAGAYYVRIQAMARKHQITLYAEFDEHDTPVLSIL